MSIRATVLLACCLTGLSGCGGAAAPAEGAATPDAPQAAPETFTYAPVLEQEYSYQQRRFQEVSVPGSPMRNAEEWIIDWKVVTRA